MNEIAVMLGIALSMAALFELARFLPWSGQITTNAIAIASAWWSTIVDTGADQFLGSRLSLAIATGIALGNVYMRYRKAPVVRPPQEGVRDIVK